MEVIRFQLSVVCFQLSVVDYLFSVICFRLSVFGCQLSVFSYRLSVVRFLMSVFCFRLTVFGSLLRWSKTKTAYRCYTLCSISHCHFERSRETNFKNTPPAPLKRGVGLQCFAIYLSFEFNILYALFLKLLTSKVISHNS